MIKAKFRTSAGDSEQIIVLATKGDTSLLSQLLGAEQPAVFSGEEKRVHRAMHLGKKYFFLGMGDDEAPKKIKSLGEYYSINLGYDLCAQSTDIVFPNEYSHDQCELFLLGFLSGTYQINEKSKKKHFLANPNTFIHCSDLDDESWLKSLHLAEGQSLARRWLDRGQNQKTAPQLAAFLADWSQDLSIDIKILNRQECQEQGLAAYLAVNQGSNFDASFTVLEYNPKDPLLHLGLVGKCITFDTGGISIKSSTNLHYMKSDMGGATAVLGAMHAIAKQQLPVHVVAILPITDNAVDRTAYAPSDIISSHAGQRIEVIDTDAEGRMTLADGLSYLIKEYSPEIVIDLATLTGSAVRTLGSAAAALFTENDNLQEQLRTAGDRTGEKLWPLPMWDEYRRNLDSDIADLKNYSGRPLSGASDAAVFLKDFTHGHKNWAHLDIAGVAFGKTAFGRDKSATAYGVHLIYQLVEMLLSDTR